MNSERVDILGLSLEELMAFAEELGEPKYRGKQLFNWIYRKIKTDFDEMTDLPKGFRAKVKERATAGTLTLEEVQTSRDGTQKLLFSLRDGRQIESVIIPNSDGRISLCISSQAGCPLNCQFCYTATLGAGRNLTAGEIVAQFIEASKLLPEGKKLTNVIFMGMGEPLLNLKNVIKALRIFSDERGLNLGRRRLTVSTVGIPPKIVELAEEFPARLALSLHAPTDKKRSQIIPLNKKYPLKTLLEALRKYRKLAPSSHRHPITLEYLLLKDFNTGPDDARELIRLARSLRAKVNLIPFNEHPGANFQRPTQREIEEFRKYLQDAGVRNTLRQTRGADIFAACGQLALHHTKAS